MQLYQGAIAVNQLGGHFVNGCPLPDFKRKWIIELAACGLRAADISRHLKVSCGCVSKILTRYYQTGAVQPKAVGGNRPRLSTPQVVARIAQMKQEQPSLFAWEIRGKLQAEGLCATGRMPSVSSINRILRSLPVGMSVPDQFAFLTKPLQPGFPLPGERRPEDSAEAPVSLLSPQRIQEGVRLPVPWSQHKSRTVFSKQQLEVLEEAFQGRQYPEAATREKLASATRLPNATIRVWFSNRRARWRREAKKALDTHHTGASCEWGPPPVTPTLLQPTQLSVTRASQSQSQLRSRGVGAAAECPGGQKGSTPLSAVQKRSLSLPCICLSCPEAGGTEASLLHPGTARSHRSTLCRQ